MLLHLQARSLPTDKLRPAYIAVNSIIYVVQVSSSSYLLNILSLTSCLCKYFVYFLSVSLNSYSTECFR